MKIGSAVAVVRMVSGVLVATMVGVWAGAPLAAWLDALLPVRLPFDLRWLGVLIAIGAMVLIASAQVSFVRFGGGTGVPNDPPRRLVASGPYRWVRNPLYISGNALLWATALMLNSAGLLGIAFVVAMGFHLFVVFYEEPQLEKRYGDAYREYTKSVPRWVPRFSKASEFLHRSK
jgi:protein-S-isoprenylcysteine O-methyltransferase Ste14